MSEKQTPLSDVVPEKSCCCEGPPEVEMEIRNYLFQETCANSDKMADIDVPPH